MKRVALSLHAIIVVIILIASLPLLGQSKTLRDEVREKGSAKHSLWEDLPRSEPHTLAQLVKRSDLIVKGQVVSETARLSEDESTVLTDYTVEIAEVLKDTQREFKAGDSVTVSKYGGSILIDGKPAEVDTPTFPPIPVKVPGLFFVVRADKPNHFWQRTFSLGDFGVWLFKNGTLNCKTERKKAVPYTSNFCGKSDSDVLAAVMRYVADPGGAE
jgi:hypothetical protein